MTSGLLTLNPDRILAVDTDPSSRAAIRYSFEEGNPANFHEYFEINPNSGWVKQIKAANRSIVNKFDLIVKVREYSIDIAEVLQMILLLFLLDFWGFHF